MNVNKINELYDKLKVKLRLFRIKLKLIKQFKLGSSISKDIPYNNSTQMLLNELAGTPILPESLQKLYEEDLARSIQWADELPPTLQVSAPDSSGYDDTKTHPNLMLRRLI